MRYVLLFSIGLSTVVAAQPPTSGARTALAAADYARAERLMAYNTNPLVLHGGVHATWLPDDRFWYRTRTENGEEAVLVDATRATRAACDLTPCRERRQDAPGGGRSTQRTDVPSPDGTRTAFIRDWNLWVRDIASGRETALT